MAQEFSLRVTLVDGQGNFGSIDGDMPAAMRYTEVRMEKITNSLLDDLENDTVDFQRQPTTIPNQEPTVLPARFPNLLVNGAGGIAVGMATNIPSHNLGEVIDATLAVLDNPDITVAEIMQFMPGPGFSDRRASSSAAPASARPMRRARLDPRSAAASTTEEMRGNREALIITEIPYQVNKATMIEKMAELVRDKRIEGISDIRDESDRHGIRVVIELKRDAVPDVVLNQLYRFTPLQILVRLQLRRAQWRQAGADERARHARRLRRLPRGSGDAAHPLPAQQGARPRPCAGRPRRRGRQYRRGHRADPRGARSGDGARAADGSATGRRATWRR